MKKSLLFLILICASLLSYSQNPCGAINTEGLFTQEWPDSDTSNWAYGNWIDLPNDCNVSCVDIAYPNVIVDRDCTDNDDPMIIELNFNYPSCCTTLYTKVQFRINKCTQERQMRFQGKFFSYKNIVDDFAMYYLNDMSNCNDNTN